MSLASDVVEGRAERHSWVPVPPITLTSKRLPLPAVPVLPAAVVPALLLTVNKAQGKTLTRVRLDLGTYAFAHGRSADPIAQPDDTHGRR